MNLIQYEHPTPVLVEGENLAATRHFRPGIGGVVELTVTPFGVVARRTRGPTDRNAPELADLLLLPGGGWAIVEKRQPQPAALQQQKGTKR